MDQFTMGRMAEDMAMVASIQVSVEGMKAANRTAELQGIGLPYGEKEFIDASKELAQLSVDLRSLAER